MREHELEGVPHGFRSTLRTWLTDHTDISYEIAEMIIAHQVGSQVERATTGQTIWNSDVITWSYGRVF